MKLILLILTFTLNTSPLWAGECFDAAKQFGKANRILSGDCIQKTLKLASGNLKQTSVSGNFQSVGYANVLISRQLDPLKETVIVGQYTELVNIVATATDEENKEIYALDSSKNAVFVFDSTMPGNVAPKRYLKSDELKGAVAIAVDAARNALIVVKPKSVLTYGRLAYNEGKRPDQSIKKISLVDEPELKTSSVSSASYNSSTGILSLVDSSKVIFVQLNMSGQASVEE